MFTFLKALVVSLCLAAALFGQATTVSGTVTDPTGAAMPSITVTLNSIDTGTQRDAKSDGQGRYNFSQVPPGNYRINAKAPGFADVAVDKIEILVNQPATIEVQFQKLGETTTSVQVEARAVQVNTTDATLGNAMTSQAITELPMYARNVAGLLALQPGVTSFGSFGQQNLDDRSGSVNGGRSDQSNITLDGTDVNQQNNRAAFSSVLRVTPDSIEEFRVVTTNGGADTGRGSGADISLITKSGTNEIHGSLYEYRRGKETAANSFFLNRSGWPRRRC